MATKQGAKASKVARAISEAEGYSPDGVFLYLIERFYNARLSDKDRTDLAFRLMPYTRRRLSAEPIPEVKEAIESGRLVVIAQPPEEPQEDA